MIIQPSYFIDYLTVKQSHPGGGLPILHDGFFISLDRDGKPIFEVHKSLHLEGSYDTKLLVSCDGCTVKLSGNVGAFGRLDNVFGYSLDECIFIANTLLATLDLPPFTRGESYLVNYAHRGASIAYTGASFSRIDVTTNLSLFSDSDAKAFLNHLSGQKLYRTKQKSYGPGETVYTVASGEGSKHFHVKYYLKSEEVKYHKSSFLYSRLQSELKPKKTPESAYLFSLIDYLEQTGCVRYECSIKSNALRKHEIAYWGTTSMEKLTLIANERLQPSLSASVASSSISELPAQAQAIYHAWRGGLDVRSMYKHSQFYKYRKILLSVGVDISFPPSVRIEPLRIREINVSPARIPNFYQLPRIAA